MTEVATTDLQLVAADGWPLAATLYRSAARPQRAVIVSSGTGFPRRFYRHFAHHLAAGGALVLTYDYRGIGGSLNARRGFTEIDYTDWGRLDMPTAVEAMEAQAGDLPITHVAHSVGGHFLGLMPNHARLARHAFISVGTGYWGGHHPRNWPLEFYFWWGLGSYSLFRFNEVRSIGGWSGEPLPPRLFRTWRRWSHQRGYFRPELKRGLHPQAYDEVRAPIASWIFTDDPIATRKSGAELLAMYPSAATEMRVRSPRALGQRRIGHEGAFRPGQEKLWQEVADWLAEA